jgi:hypothetical protein
MIDREPYRVFRIDDAQEHDFRKIVLDAKVQQQSGRWAGRARCP